jgi:hypothetical protein
LLAEVTEGQSDAYLSAASIFNTDVQKHSGVETLSEKGAIGCVLIAKVHFNAIPWAAKECSS